MNQRMIFIPFSLKSDMSNSIHKMRYRFLIFLLPGYFPKKCPPYCTITGMVDTYCHGSKLITYLIFIVFLTYPDVLLSLLLYFFFAFFGTLNIAFLLMPLNAFLPIFEILTDLNVILLSVFFL